MVRINLLRLYLNNLKFFERFNWCYSVYVVLMYNKCKDFRSDSSLSGLFAPFVSLRRNCIPPLRLALLDEDEE